MIHNRLRVRFDEKSIDRILKHLDTSNLPGATVGIAIGGRPVYRKGFGLASMELPVTLTPRTRMRIYSITKHFTCLAYLLFCEEGKAMVDDPIEKYLPELHRVTHRVTMRQLMSNTSGLRDACEIRWFFSGIEGTVPARDLLALYRDFSDVNFAPGEAWCYNNGGFHILSAVIEKIADQRLEEVFRKRIFEPAGMYDTLLRRVDTDFISNSATMHMISGEGKYERKYLPGELLGEGGLVSTVDDMLRWLRHMANPIVGHANTWALLCTTQRLRDGAETGYALGLLRGNCCGVDTIFHSGAGLGSSSQMIKVPEADLDVVVLVNRHDFNASELAASILTSCLGLSREPPGEKGGVAGVFRSPTTGRVIQLHVNGRKQMALVDGAENWSLVLSADRMLRPGPPCSSNLALRLHGEFSRPDRIVQEYYGRLDELMPVQGGSSLGVSSLSGDFRADNIGVHMTVLADDMVGQVVTAGRFGSRSYRLERLCGGMWRMRSNDGTDEGGILAIARDGMEATLRTTRTWQVSFQRV